MVKTTTFLDKYFSTVISIIEDRLYFTYLTNSCNGSVRSDDQYHYFTMDKKFIYNSFNDDFGPLNLSCVYRFNHTMMRKLKMKSLSKRKLVYYTLVNETDGEQRKVNSAFLMGTFMVIQLKMKSEDVCSVLESQQSFISFKDASFKPYDYQLSLFDCLSGFEKGVEHGFFDMKSFDVLEYEHFEKVDNGDFNWIVPKRILAFCSPQSGVIKEKGAVAHTPAWYVGYFKKNKISVVVRLNESLYDPEEFRRPGLEHHDLFFPDGSTPSQGIVCRFIKICEEADARDVAVAVHCKAGLGRTGTLIACYIMKKYKMSSREAIAWIRIARPGSIIGQQQHFLDRAEKKLLSEPKVSPGRVSSFSPSPREGGDSKMAISELESGVGDMNLSVVRGRNEATAEGKKKVLHVIPNAPHPRPPIHSHFLRSQRRARRVGEERVNIENIPQNDADCEDALQGEKLNNIKARRSMKDQRSRSALKNRSRPRSGSAGRRLNNNGNSSGGGSGNNCSHRLARREQNLKKKCHDGDSAATPVTRCQRVLKSPRSCRAGASSGTVGSPTQTARLTRSSFRI